MVMGLTVEVQVHHTQEAEAVSTFHFIIYWFQSLGITLKVL